ncbi:MAG: lysostaphin resistance A-like protein [Promethearchaeota archaeon]
MEIKYQGRLRFFLIIAISSIISLLFQLLLSGLNTVLPIGDLYQSWIYRIFFAVTSILSCYLGLLIIQRSYPHNSEDNISNTNLQSQVKDKNIKFSNLLQSFNFRGIGWQIRDGIILLLVFYVPLDCIGYMIPGVLQYSAKSVGASVLNAPDNYFGASLLIFIVSALIIHISVATREEFVFRVFFIDVGRKEIGKLTAVLFSAILFGFAHFNYIFEEVDAGFSPFYPIIWGVSALIIGFVAAIYYAKKKRILPLIIAHFLNNIISASAIRKFVLGKEFWSYTLIYMYLPLIFIGIILFIFTFTHLRQYFRYFIAIFKNYHRENPKIQTVLIDVLLIVMLWFTLLLM